MTTRIGSIALLLLLACGGGEEPLVDSILLVTIDTCRADRIGCYGNASALTPTLDRLASEGVLFSSCITQVPSTLSSHATILTSLYPRVHGIPRNGFALPKDVRTVTQILTEKGFRTAAFVGAFPLHHSFGLDRGFSVFDDTTDVNPLGGEMERPASDVTEKAAAWLRAVGGRPFFAWVHYFDPHWPYIPPHPFAAARRPPSSRFSPGSLADANAIRLGLAAFHDVDREVFFAAYDGEIAFLDRCLARLLESIPDERRERLLVLVVGDHGESFGRHGYYFDHGKFLWSDALEVPLILHGPSVFPQPRIETATVRLLDLAPTILEAAGIRRPRDYRGESLVAAARGPIEGRPALSEASKPWSVEAAGAYPNELKARSIHHGRWKLILTPYADKRELYDWHADPGETRNLIDQEPEIAERLERELREQGGGDASGFRSQDLTAEDEVRKKLKALGYY
jgi:arylsulfatase A-like enzyme